jgi:hypothetical protein
MNKLLTLAEKGPKKPELMRYEATTAATNTDPANTVFLKAGYADGGICVFMKCRNWSTCKPKNTPSGPICSMDWKGNHPTRGNWMAPRVPITKKQEYA